MPPLPLKGVRAIDLTIVGAGPFTSTLVRVESLQRVHVNIRGLVAVPAAAAQHPTKTQYPNRDPGERHWEGVDPTGAIPVTRTYVEISLHAGPLDQFSLIPLSTGRPAPTLGEHNAYVYRDLLGVTGKEQATLERERHIGERYVEA